MQGKILQVLPSIIRTVDGELAIEIDYLNSLRFYLKNFEKVTVASPLTEDDVGFGLQNCTPVKDICETYGEALELIPLPQSYKFKDFIQNYRSVRSLLREKIQAADYLEFSPHALIGDWSGVACLEAIQQNRPYVISASVVYHEVAKVGIQNSNFIKRLVKESVSFPTMKQYHRYLYRHAQLGLIQGQATYEEYAHYFQRSGIFYNVTITEDDRISHEKIQAKVETVLSHRGPLKLAYVGRAMDMKGAIEWVRTIDDLVKSGVPVQAAWIGDGPLLDEMKHLAEELGITEHIAFLGYMTDRQKIFAHIVDAHIFLFCHKTSESPRCLIEALAQGCALVGYRNAYPLELVKTYGGGQFVELGNWRELAAAVRALHQDRNELASLIKAAAQSGGLYERETAYENRLTLLRSSYAE